MFKVLNNFDLQLNLICDKFIESAKMLYAVETPKLSIILTFFKVFAVSFLEGNLASNILFRLKDIFPDFVFPGLP